MIESIIFNTELLALYEKERIVVVEASSGADAMHTYSNEHLRHARFVDLERDLSWVTNPKVGGRHPLPYIRDFSNLLGRIGIHPNSHVVVYDRANGTNAAARFWWMMRAAGHETVQVLSGGFDQAKAFGIPTDSKELSRQDLGTYPGNSWGLFPTINMEQVAEAAIDTGSLIIDVRAQRRFTGEDEPIDAVAGHIPNAINIPLSNNLTSEGFFKSKQEIRTLYDPYVKDRDFDKIVVHCGSGVSACHTILALDYGGFPIPKLYIGSWSEWSRNDNPIETS